MDTQFGKNFFDLNLKKNITEHDIENYSSKFIIDTVNLDTKDLFEIENIVKDNVNTIFYAQINQRKIHPNSEGGFHLSAITVADIIQFFLNTNFPEMMEVYKLENFIMSCKKTVRSLRPKFYLKMCLKPNEALIFDFRVEDGCYQGSIEFQKRKTNLKDLSNYNASLLKNSFSIRKANIDRNTINATIDLECLMSDKTDVGLGIGLILAISSQISIIQIYTLSNAASKTNGVVMVGCDIQNKVDKTSRILKLKSIAENIRPSRTLKNHLIVDVKIESLDRSFEANITYVFEPL